MDSEEGSTSGVMSMRKRLGIFMVAALAAAGLTACTQADSGSSSAGAGSSATAGSGTIETGTVEQNGDRSGGSGTAGSGSASGTSASGIEVNASDETVLNGGVSIEDEDEEETEIHAEEENLSDEQLGALEEDPDSVEDTEGWSGTYLNENDETLTVSIVVSETISFAFTNSGISGTAVLDGDGNQATYEGDDYHIVVFDFAGTDIKVSVLSEEDYDTSESPLNGVFVRQ